LNSKSQQVEWRRHQVLELSSKGYNQSEIARTLQIDRCIISRDVAILREQSKQNIKTHIDEKLPEEYEKCLVGISSILKEAWNTANSQNGKDKLHALSLAKDCYSMKLELLTNATIVEDALKFVDRNNTNKNNKEESSSNKRENNDEFPIVTDDSTIVL
jgi:hypothetical protein